MTRPMIWGLLVPLLAGTAIVTGCKNVGYEGDSPGECSDGADNDRDGLYDCDDDSCSGADICVNPPDPDACDPTVVDADEDGYDDIEDPENPGAVLDCDDCNADISPDAVEIPYDLVDNDCSTETRDDDADQDGYAVNQDCNDEAPDIHPDAEEIPYDGIDNDCAAATPDDDLDGDGYLLADDCDDADPEISPDAEEIPYDGIDNDCAAGTLEDDLDQDGYALADDCDDGDSANLPGVIATCLGVHQADRTFRGLEREEYGEALEAGDLDGDGVDEILIGAAGAADAAGAVMIYAGETLMGSLVAVEVYDQLGRGLSMRDDLDGDGRADLLASAAGADPGGLTNVGEVYLMGSARYGEWSAGGSIAELSTAVFRGETELDYLGNTFTTGDLDGDGLAELLIGSPGNDVAATNGGTIAFFSGAAIPTGVVAIASADTFLTGAYRDEIGDLSTAIVGDLNGDGYRDLVVGLDNSLGASDVAAGAVWLLPGGGIPEGDARSLAFAELHGLDSGDALGKSVATGDLDGDGDDEIFVSAPYADVVSLDAGGLYLFEGGGRLSGAISAEDALLSWGGDIALESAGSSLWMAELDGDGILDLLVASPYREDRGRGYVLSGGDLGVWGGTKLDDDATTWIAGAQIGDGLGVTLATTASGAVAVGAPGVGEGEGAVYVFE